MRVFRAVANLFVLDILGKLVNFFSKLFRVVVFPQQLLVKNCKKSVF